MNSALYRSGPLSKLVLSCFVAALNFLIIAGPASAEDIKDALGQSLSKQPNNSGRARQFCVLSMKKCLKHYRTGGQALRQRVISGDKTHLIVRAPATIRAARHKFVRLVALNWKLPNRYFVGFEPLSQHEKPRTTLKRRARNYTLLSK